VFPSTAVRWGFIGVYTLLCVALLATMPRRRAAFRRLLTFRSSEGPEEA
jgi:hypothetical protein